MPKFSEERGYISTMGLHLDLWKCLRCHADFCVNTGHLPQACPSCGITNEIWDELAELER